MKATVVVAGVENVRAVDKHHVGGLVGNHCDGERLYLGGGKVLGKHFRGTHGGKNASVAEIVHVHDLHRAREYDADVSGDGAFGKNGVTGFIIGSTLKFIIPQCSKKPCIRSIEHASPAKCLLHTIYKHYITITYL